MLIKTPRKKRMSRNLPHLGELIPASMSASALSQLSCPKINLAIL